jgi:hypothetical protein
MEQNQRGRTEMTQLQALTEVFNNRGNAVPQSVLTDLVDQGLAARHGQLLPRLTTSGYAVLQARDNSTDATAATRRAING